MNIYLQFIASALVIIISAQWLARTCDRIADITKVGHFLVGSLMLAVATSAPEFFVDIRASLEGLPNLAAGDLLGSSLCNLMILCMLVLIFRQMQHIEVDKVSIRHCIVAALLTEGVTLLIYFHPSSHVANVHLGSWLILIGYIAGQLFGDQLNEATPEEAKIQLRDSRLITEGVKFLAAMGMIFIASSYIVSAAEEISRITGLGDTFVGATLLAITTSLPELASSISAIRMNAINLALGNIIGSNAFNMIIFLPMDIAWRDGSIWEHISNAFVFPAMLITSNMLLLCLVWNRSAALKQRYFGTFTILGLSLCGFVALYYA